MLARANRLVSAEDYRRLVRRGRRVTASNSVVYAAKSSGDRPARFGFIVPKTVGIAVDRNLIRRRLKAICHESLASVAPGSEVVIRALPGAAQLSWGSLRAEISASFDRSVRQA